MYTTTNYFLSTWLISTMMTILYPIISSSIAFSFLSFTDSSLQNYGQWLKILLIQALSGASFGFMIGSLVSSEITGLVINQFVIIIFNFGSGIFINNKTAKPFVKLLVYTSPFRYACEAMMRCFLKDKANVEGIYDRFGYTLGSEKCVWACVVFMVVFFILSWISVEWKSRQLFKN